MTRHCHKCGWEWKISGQPGRNDSCHRCGLDMKVCLNCVHYDARVAQQCKERRAEPVQYKDTANFCEYFEFVRRIFAGASAADKREQEAREKLKKLFGD
ncbi:MAG TPA: hypothetical protein VGH19_21195 [Verrucomicrobiae bacterium]